MVAASERGASVIQLALEQGRAAKGVEYRGFDLKTDAGDRPERVTNGYWGMTINNDANRNLAEAWIKLQYLPRKSDARDELWWAWEQLDELCRTQPERAWDVIQEIIAQDQSDQILADVGAGPIEDLLVHHGARIIDRVESCARSNPAFKRMLGVVWKNSIPDEVWKRVKVIAPPSW